VQATISTNPDDYRRLLASLSTEDRKIYNASFEKSINVDLGGDPAAYATMLERCAALKSECEFVKVDKQPTSDLIPLVLMIREQIPAYKAIVAGVVAHAGASRGVVGAEEVAMLEAKLVAKQMELASALDVNTEYRKGQLKVESASLETRIAAIKSHPGWPTTIYRSGDQTKSPWTCLAASSSATCDYAAMAAVVDAFADQHKLGAVQIARMKDRWNTPSEGGWRDLMLNIVVNGKVVFEVQVVLHAMLVARSAMDAHIAYNQFRSFAEVFGLLKLSMEVADDSGAKVVVVDAGDAGGDSWSEGRTTGNPTAAAAVRIAELEAKVAALTAENATVDAKVAAVEAERDADKKQHDAMVAQLQAQLAARV
jgi:hypothetical protein